MLREPIQFAAPATAAAALLAFTGCTISQAPQASAAGVRDASAAQHLVGEVKPTDADAMRLTGATIVRQIAPGDPVTHDLRQNRVTVETDPVSGRVVGARAGRSCPLLLLAPQDQIQPNRNSIRIVTPTEMISEPAQPSRRVNRMNIVSRSRAIQFEIKFATASL